MAQAKWIWYPGDYELHHNLQLHSRREMYECQIPVDWHLSSPYAICDFHKTITAPEDFSMKVITNSTGYGRLGGTYFPLNQEVTVPAGTHAIRIIMIDYKAFPSFYVDSKYVKSDESWKVCHGTSEFLQAACTPAYTLPTDDPTVFPFSYKRMDPVSVEKCKDGYLYDFGKEVFALLQIEGADPAERFLVNYGESREEALDCQDAVIREWVQGKDTDRLAGRGFRYVFLQTLAAEQYCVWADYEYLPLEDVGDFSCDNPLVKKIYDVCAYTFHLNSREFYLDGIKRDRWVWSGDAYQSYMINQYLYFDPEITKRTITSLVGKPPYEVHLNTINDYTLYQLMAIYEYYFSTGDMDFVRFIYPRAKALYQFVLDRLDEDGLMVQRPKDWIFIDWSDIDKSGPLAAEQILLWQTHKSMAKLAVVCGEAEEPYLERAAQLRTVIMERFWMEEFGAFIDTYTSGRNHVTRHANVFAILYDFVEESVQKRLLKTVLKNDAITQITTPYFKFYELMALCKLGELETMQRLLESYWGGMLALGATTIWEQYNPNETGVEHLAMYGRKYERSLCHAWGSGPIYLLGRYCLGVVPTGEKYETFTVSPNLGIYTEMKGTVPIYNGKVDVEWKDGTVTVCATRDGGTLVLNGVSYPLPAGVPVSVTEVACE